MESLGGLAEDSISILHSLGKAISLTVGSQESSPETCQYCFIELPSYSGGEISLFG